MKRKNSIYLASGTGSTHKPPPFDFGPPSQKKLVFSTFQMILSKKKKLHYNYFFLDFPPRMVRTQKTTCKPRSTPQG